ncbi:alkB, alkylation repair protein 6 [Karstenula rhodostoma CBS 690.94]|uniref:AlkB, alkylation repair protein 6 n=1 Tax=Karstenula rhodostoma CBS 690.94 TaxID=1392251 RepID=A0A9P4PT54_9PLEO|nr:alkB, alkylation repair protein 6 [Karstenula rhodostoma CBS 690.94]
MDLPNGREGLEAFRIASLPPEFYYIPNFITASEEASILDKIPANRWITLSHRRLQTHPSTLTKTNTLLGAPLPPYLLNPITERFKKLGIFDATPHRQPNHVLINEYRKGEGIMPHEDGAAYAPVVATVSLGGSLCLEITGKGSAAVDEAESRSGEEEKYALPTRILQEPRSLLVTRGAAYGELLHGIAAVEADEGLRGETVANWGMLGDRGVYGEGRNERGTRVSLTYRDVLKVSGAASKVLGMGRR